MAELAAILTGLALGGTLLFTEIAKKSGKGRRRKITRRIKGATQRKTRRGRVSRRRGGEYYPGKPPCPRNQVCTR